MSNTREQISRCMRANKSKDTTPELDLRKKLWHRGLRYRKNCKDVFGKPDVVFMKARIAVFVDGRMWHGYDWGNRKDDFKSNREFWLNKIERNMKRDVEVTNTLVEADWTVIRVWDFEVKDDVKACADEIERIYNEKTNKKTND